MRYVIKLTIISKFFFNKYFVMTLDHGFLEEKETHAKRT